VSNRESGGTLVQLIVPVEKLETHGG
jgi:hypothetical protein